MAVGTGTGVVVASACGFTGGIGCLVLAGAGGVGVGWKADDAGEWVGERLLGPQLPDDIVLPQQDYSQSSVPTV